MAAVLIHLKQWGVPGFRSGNPIKAVFASVGYLAILIWVLAGLSGKPGVSVFGLVVLAIVFLVSNAWDMRSRLPLLGSSKRLAAVAGWAIVAVLFVSTWGWAAAETPPSSNATSFKSGTGGVGGGTGSTTKPDAASAATPTPTATPTATATPSPTPTANPTPAPTPRATAPPAAATQAPVKPTQAPPAPATCGAPANPWGYNFCGGGKYIYGPPSTFCTYFSCIPSFWKSTNGYVEQCADGMYSHSGGRSGSCSYHGGNNQPLFGP